MEAPHRRLIVPLRLLALALLLAAPAAAQRRNDPASCPYCGGDPERMAAAGIRSHGGFEFGRSTTGGIDAFMPAADIRWIETPHFELGLALGPHRVKQDEKAKVRAELGRLAEVLPEIKPKTKILDPWLRAHIYAQRLEDLWTRFLELMQTDGSAFPPKPRTWNMQGVYWGQGPYLGMEGKYEVLLLPSKAASVLYLEEQFGLQMTLTQRWNLMERDTLSLTVHLDQGNLKDDGALHGHIAFNMTVNMLDGFKHYSYELPIWLREGLGHWVERDLNPRHNTFDSSEGAVAAMTRKENWEPEVRKLLRKGEAVRMAELIRLKAYAELELRHHYTSWSIIDWLVRTNPEGLACLCQDLTGLLNKEGIPDGSNMPDAHRAAVKECLGLGYAQLDAQWSEWVEANYGTK